MSVLDPGERRGASTGDRTGESCLFETILTVSTEHVYLTFRLTEIYSARSSTNSVCGVCSLQHGAEVYCKISK